LGAATRIVDVTNQALFRFLRHITQRDLSGTLSIALDGVFSDYTRNNHEALFTVLLDLCGAQSSHQLVSSSPWPRRANKVRLVPGENPLPPCLLQVGIVVYKQSYRTEPSWTA
jgi:hypothetical protein